MARSGAKWWIGASMPWDHRVTTSRADKLRFVAQAGWQAARRGALYPLVSRDGLWTRPG
jgi:phytoene synthase